MTIGFGRGQMIMGNHVIYIPYNLVYTIISRRGPDVPPRQIRLQTDAGNVLNVNEAK